MAIPHKLSLKLHEILGTEASQAMADWMNGIEGGQSELRADMAELRHAMDVQLAQLREEMRVGFSELRQEMRAGFAAIDARFAATDAKLAETKVDMKVDIMKWAFGFWIASLAMLGGMLALVVRLGR